MSKTKDGSVAPKERINIKYVPATEGQTAEVELPLNLLVVGDMKGRADDSSLNVDLSFGSLNDFSPDSIVNKVPELKKLLELREALTAVKGPLGNVPAFRARLTELLENDESREKLLEELNLVSPKK